MNNILMYIIALCGGILAGIIVVKARETKDKDIDKYKETINDFYNMGINYIWILRVIAILGIAANSIINCMVIRIVYPNYILTALSLCLIGDYIFWTVRTLIVADKYADDIEMLLEKTDKPRVYRLITNCVSFFVYFAALLCVISR